jgi:hypothetical protein
MNDAFGDCENSSEGFEEPAKNAEFLLYKWRLMEGLKGLLPDSNGVVKNGASVFGGDG